MKQMDTSFQPTGWIEDMVDVIEAVEHRRSDDRKA